MRVVIVDDHAAVRAAVGAAVSAKGAKIIARARSPDEMFEVLREQPCDLLVCDYAMPIDDQVDGIEMVHRVRTQWPRLPVIMLTSISSAGVLRALLGQGVLGLIDKAAPISELTEAMAVVVRGARVVSTSFVEAIEQDCGDTDDPVLKREIVRLIERGRPTCDIADWLLVSHEFVEGVRGEATGSHRDAAANPE